jgi:hypothetical protein
VIETRHREAQYAVFADRTDDAGEGVFVPDIADITGRYRDRLFGGRDGLKRLLRPEDEFPTEDTGLAGVEQ